MITYIGLSYLLMIMLTLVGYNHGKFDEQEKLLVIAVVIMSPIVVPGILYQTMKELI